MAAPDQRGIGKMHHHAHGERGEERLAEYVKQRQAEPCAPCRVDGIGDARKGVAHHGGDCRALNVYGRDVHENDQRHDFQQEADKQVEHGHVLLAHALQNACHRLHHGKEDHADGGGVH